jgi:hypothetical protein
MIGRMNCKLDALLDLTLENRDSFLYLNPFPRSLPFPVLSVVGTIAGCKMNGYYPLHKMIQKFWRADSDGVVSVPDQIIPGSMIVTIPGLSHTLGLFDPVPFFGALFSTLVYCRPTTHDDRSVSVYLFLKGGDIQCNFGQPVSSTNSSLNYLNTDQILLSSSNPSIEMSIGNFSVNSTSKTLQIDSHQFSEPIRVDWNEMFHFSSTRSSFQNDELVLSVWMQTRNGTLTRNMIHRTSLSSLTKFDHRSEYFCIDSGVFVELEVEACTDQSSSKKEWATAKRAVKK